MPPVSIMSKITLLHSASAARRSRVVPGTSSTMARRSPAKRLKSVLFPTFGRPTKATIGLGIHFQICLFKERLYHGVDVGVDFGVDPEVGVGVSLGVRVELVALVMITST